MPESRARKSQIRWLAWAAAVAVVALGGAVLAAPALLDSAWLQGRLSAQEGLTVRWEDSRPGWGSLAVSALAIERDDPTLPLALEVDSARLELGLLDLLRGRLMIRSLEASGLERLEVAGHRLGGEGRLTLSGLSLTREEVGVARLTLALEEAGISRDGLALVEEISLTADLAAAPFDPAAHPGQAALRFVSGDLALGARADAWDLFNPYLAELGWLGLAGRGSLAGALTLQEGELAPGSRLTLDAPTLAVTLDEAALLAESGQGQAPAWARPDASYRLQGRGSVVLGVDADATLTVTLADLAMHQGDTPAPLLTGRHFRLASPLPTDLAAPLAPPSTADLHWEGATLPDIAALGRFLPPGGDLVLEGGSAALDGALHYREGRLDGAFRLAGEGVALRFQEQALGGDLRLDLALGLLDPDARRLDLSGSRLRLDASSSEEAESLSLDLTLHEARLASRVPLAALRDHPRPPLDGELALSGHLDRLGFLDPYLAGLFEGQGVTLRGGGELEARARLQDGELDAGSRLSVTSGALGVGLPHLAAEGRGHFSAEWRDQQERPLHLAARLEEASLTRHRDGARLLLGASLDLEAEGAPPEAGDTPLPRRAEITWQDARLPDVAVLAPYLPPGAPFALHGGSAASEGRLVLDDVRLGGHLTLTGQHITGRLLDESVSGEMRLELALRDAAPDGSRFDASGSRLELAASARGAAADQPLGSTLVVRKARFLDLDDPTRRRGHLMLEGMVDRLGFLDAFLPEAHDVTLRGRGRLEADLRLAGDRLLPESRLHLDADDLAVGFLDYRAEGRGELRALIDGSAASPGARLTLSLPRFAVRREAGAQGEAGEAGQERTWLAGRHLRLETHTPRFALDPADLAIHDVTTRVSLPIVEVPDLGLYAAYLPTEAGVALRGGRASLEADLELTGLSARGDLLLQAFGTELELADQRLSGDLRLEARLREGDLEARRFDASGSLLRLDNITRRDADGQGEAGWWARLVLEEGRLTWAEPLEVDARIGLAMRDSGLLARLLLAGAREREWLGRLLTVRGIQGEARLGMDEHGIRLGEARLDGGPLTLLADLHFHADRLDGSLYARLGRLAVGVALEEGERTLRFWQPRRWYEGGAEGEPPALEETTPEAFREALSPP